MTYRPCKIKKALTVTGATDIEIHNGSNYKYGFFVVENKLYYFTTDDKEWDENNKLLSQIRKNETPVKYREAKNRLDISDKQYRWNFNRILHSYGYYLREGGEVKVCRTV